MLLLIGERLELANAIGGGTGGAGVFSISSSLLLSSYCRILLNDARRVGPVRFSTFSFSGNFAIRDFLVFFFVSASVLQRSSPLTALSIFFLASS